MLLIVFAATALLLLLACVNLTNLLGMALMVVFGATPLVLAAVGIYGVIAYASAQRLGEIATRRADFARWGVLQPSDGE